MYKKRVANLCVVLLVLIVFGGLFQAREQLNKRFSDLEYVIQPTKNQKLEQYDNESTRANDKLNDWINFHNNKVISNTNKFHKGWDVGFSNTLN
jgi:hypothetical protein